VYPPKGEYQLQVRVLEPLGKGSLQQAFEELKERLAKEGLFDAGRKRPLPLLPRRVGIVTSPGGAVIRDFLRVLRSRYGNLDVLIYPARVQGPEAAAEIVAGIRAIQRVPLLDVLVVARGGGSLEDLWPFNEEAVARALAASRVPTISAVGHETDVTIADFVADRRAPTPSAAAEMVVARKDDVSSRIDRLERRLESVVSMRVGRLESRLRALESRPGFAGYRARLAMRGRHASELQAALHQSLRRRLSAEARRLAQQRARLEARDVRHQLASVRRRVEAGHAALAAGMDVRYHRIDARLRATIGRLDALSPLSVLSRGYAVCFSDDRSAVIRRADQVTPGDAVRVRLGNGEIRCDVRDTGPA
jgi:exodeoxyribonuclease VII large subunit